MGDGDCSGVCQELRLRSWKKVRELDAQGVDVWVNRHKGDPLTFDL